MPRALILAVLGVLVLSGAPAQDFGTVEPVWTLESKPASVVPGQSFDVVVRVDVPEGFYQDAASPFLTLEPEAPAVVQARGSSTPVTRAGKASFTGSFTLTRTLLLPPETAPGRRELLFHTGWQICRENGVCLLPAEGTLKVGLTVAAATAPNGGPVTGFWWALLGAFLGGLLLNLMPCVFPVLALKAVDLVSASSRDRSTRRREALGFALGGWGTLTLLGLVTALLLALGQRLEWGFSFQQPAFVWALTLGFWLLTLQLWGLWPWVRSPFTLTTAGPKPPSWVGGAFLVVAAAPCTAPLLGPALGVALTLPPPLVPLVFAAVGLGLVLPLLVLQVVPGWARILPQPGPWMVVAERVAGWALAVTVLYLAWVLTRQTESDRVWMMLAFLGALAALGTLVGKSPRNGVRALALGALVLTAAASFWVTAPPVSPRAAGDLPAGWQAFSAQDLDRAVNEGRPVLVDATAAWCATCQVNEAAVLDRSEVNRELEALGVVRLRADYTNPDPVIRAWLASVGRAGLPVYALYRPGKPVYLFPELLSDDNFTRALPVLLKGN